MTPVILSGGVGSRLWPLSREKMPKQFCPIFGDSLFRKTLERFAGSSSAVVVSSASQKILVEKELMEIRGGEKVKAFFEPIGMNTAPAVALACHYMLTQNKEDEVLGVFPSDHWIDKQDVFLKALQLAENCATQGQIVTLGIEPQYPATGFGYIECLPECFLEDFSLKAMKVKGFHEKPSKEIAEGYLKSGVFKWNSGMFVFQVKVMVSAFKEFMPEMWNSLSKLKNDYSNLQDIYESLKPESLDYGIMEKAKNQVCIPCQPGWSDLGSWDDIASFSQKSAADDSSSIFEVESQGNFVYSTYDKTVALVNVDNVNVVNTEDALLVTGKGTSQGVKDIVEQLKKKKPEMTKDHVYEYRPWGMYRNLREEEDFKVKVITVNPQQQLSYQSHVQREEIWVLVEGQGEVVINDKTIEVKKGSVVHIPKQARHRMRNNSQAPLKFVEVQMGEYFGEDDITRYQDDYNRS